MNLLNKLIDDFAKLNKNKWPEMCNNKNKILLDGFQYNPNYLISAATIARAINEVKNYEPIVIISGNLKKNNEVKKIFNSYGIKNYFDVKKYRFNIFIIFKAIITTLKVYINIPNLDMFIEYKLNDIKIGDLIYDQYIRANNRYSKIKLRSLSFFKELLKSHFKFYLYGYFIKKNDFKYIILSHRVYVSYGMLARIALKYGSRVIISGIRRLRCYYNYDEIFTYELKPDNKLIKYIINKQIYTKIDKFLEERFSGNIDQHDAINAYKNKKYYSKEELCNKLKLIHHYPIVFVMPHVFSDAPHSNEYMLFRDYYQWFLETIKYINKIKGINWIIKPHPSSYMYSETGEVEKIVMDLKLNNINLAPSDLSTASVFNISKTIITVSGTAGIEAACLGIKPIIAGKAVYSDFGIAYEPKNKHEYFSILKNINFISPLNEKEIIIAKAILYWTNIGAFSNSTILPLKDIVPNPEQKVMIKQTIDSCKTIIKNLKCNNPQDDPYYLGIKKMIKRNEKYLTMIKF